MSTKVSNVEIRKRIKILRIKQVKKVKFKYVINYRYKYEINLLPFKTFRIN